MLNIALILLSANAFAAIRETGGSSPAPRAVVIQSHFINGRFDTQGVRLALNLIARFVSANHVTAFTQRTEDQFADRKYMCIDFASSNTAWKAQQIFNQQLVAHPALEVVTKSRCR